MTSTLTRRKFLARGAAVCIVPMLAFGRNQALAQTPQVDPAGAQAKALEYTHQSVMADKNCANCQLYTGDAGSDWGPCAIFPGQQVASAGWCKAWVAKA